MISLEEIRADYPAQLHDRSAFLLREYLQYRMLRLIYRSKHASKLIFLGGTCLRLIHQNRRFSEDLDFDNLGLDTEQFKELGEEVRAGLAMEGYEVEVEIKGKTAFRCKVRFPGILFQHGLSHHAEQRVLIQFDTEPQRYDYAPEIKRLAKWDVAMDLPCCSQSLLLAQKCYAIMGRPRNKGRDFFDVVFLLSRNVEPDLNYLKDRVHVANREELAQVLLDHCKKLDMSEQAEDVRPFVFEADTLENVVHFPQIIQQKWLP